MRALNAESEEFEVPLTPLIDVVFLLLIFFLVATNFTRKEIDHKVTLPAAEGGEKGKAEPKNLVINLRKSGAIIIAGRVVPSDQLKEKIKAWKKANPEKYVSIRGDGEVTYEKVMRIMGVCKAAGVTDVELPVMEPAGGDG